MLLGEGGLVNGEIVLREAADDHLLDRRRPANRGEVNRAVDPAAAEQ